MVTFFVLTMTDATNVPTIPIFEFIKHLRDAFDVVVTAANEGNETFKRVLLQHPYTRKSFGHNIHTIATFCPGMIQTVQIVFDLEVSSHLCTKCINVISTIRQ